MQSRSFEYHRPTSLDEALGLLAEVEDARPLAGGQSLLPMMKMRLASPAALVDLARVPELTGVRREGDVLRIGAMTRYAEALASDDVRAGCPVLAECIEVIGDPQVRNVGTLGGSVAHADPAADLPTALLALDAEVEVSGPGGARTLPVGDFFLGLFTTALAEGELVTGLRVPVLPAGAGAAYVKHPHPASRYAVVGIATLLEIEDGRCARARLAVGGVTGRPVLAEAAAGRLADASPDRSVLEEAATLVADDLQDPVGDAYASEEYRVHLAGVLARRALTSAAERAAG